MRFAARCDSVETARRVSEEVEGLYLAGPAGGGGVSGSQREILAIASTLIPAESVKTVVEMKEVQGETA
jgi:hypothetical protein